MTQSSSEATAYKKNKQVEWHQHRKRGSAMGGAYRRALIGQGKKNNSTSVLYNLFLVQHK